MRMRTIDEGYAEIKKSDPETSLSKNAWRNMVKNGEIPSVIVGAKRLVNMDIAEQYFNNSAPVILPDAKPSPGMIRRIEV